jgi:thiamine pyrophosphate-dependent acetolactate synthase large subunit-like protein
MMRRLVIRSAAVLTCASFAACACQSGDIRRIPVRHEETAAFAAGIEAHVTGRLAV